MNKFLGLLMVLSISGNLYAYKDSSLAYPNLYRASNVRLPNETYLYNNPYVYFAKTKINYDQERVVISATLLNDDNTSAFSFAGTFSPAATAYLKPFTKSRLKTFVQASCLNYECDQIMLSIGFKTRTENPNAFAEPKFILSRIGSHSNL